VLDLFAAVRALRPRYPSLRLLMVGLVDRDKADAVTPDVAARYGIDDLTVFAGYRHDMPAMYGLMHVAVLPSHREGMPRAPMEASAMRVPCVASDVRGCREVVRSGVNGILVPVRDSQRLAEALDRLLADEPLRRRLGNGGRDVAVAEFDERQVFARTIDAYARLLQRRGLPVPLAHDRPAMSTPV
jgi:glycosyltransferase involved in cell wall biosynthesis